MSFERIKLKPAGYKRAVWWWFQVLSDGEDFLLGRKVNKNGEDSSYTNREGVIVDEQTLISKSTIIERKPARENLTYGYLEIIEGRLEHD